MRYVPLDPDMTDEEIVAAIKNPPRDVRKHAGPSSHPSGSEQKVHGRRGASAGGGTKDKKGKAWAAPLASGKPDPDPESIGEFLIPTVSASDRGRDIRSGKSSITKPDDMNQEVFNKLMSVNQERLFKLETQPRPGIDDNPEVRTYANKLFQQALATDSTVFPEMQALAAELGGTLVGTDERVKYEGSLRSKLIRTRNEDKLDSIAAAAAEVRDLNRFTMVFERESFTETMLGMFEEMENRGYELFDHKWKNYFVRGDDYDGLNTNWVTPSGAIVEIQFHTPESLEKKHASNKLYNQARDLPANSEERIQLNQQMREIWSERSHVPEGFEQLGGLTIQKAEQGGPMTNDQKPQDKPQSQAVQAVEAQGNPPPDEQAPASYEYWGKENADGDVISLFALGPEMKEWQWDGDDWVDAVFWMSATGLGGSPDWAPLTPDEAQEFIDTQDVEPNEDLDEGLSPQDLTDDAEKAMTSNEEKSVRPIKTGKKAEPSNPERRLAKSGFAPSFTPVTKRRQVRKVQSIIKSNTRPDRNQVFGWANVTFTPDGEQVVDRQGHMIDVDDLEEMAYSMAMVDRSTGVMHQSEPVGQMIESMVFTPEKITKLGLPEGSLPTGWWVGFKVPPDVYQEVKKGRYSMFSIEGTGKLEPVD